MSHVYLFFLSLLCLALIYEISIQVIWCKARSEYTPGDLSSIRPWGRNVPHSVRRDHMIILRMLMMNVMTPANCKGSKTSIGGFSSSCPWGRNVPHHVRRDQRITQDHECDDTCRSFKTKKQFPKWRYLKNTKAIYPTACH